MRRWLLMAGALALLAILPGHGTEIGQLKPAGLLYLYREQGLVCAAVDTGERGIGTDLEEALEDLKLTTPGSIYLNTVEKLILTPRTAEALPELRRVLRPAVEVCYGEEGMDAETAYAYLRAHGTGVTLLELEKENKRIPYLTYKKEQYRLGS